MIAGMGVVLIELSIESTSVARRIATVVKQASVIAMISYTTTDSRVTTGRHGRVDPRRPFLLTRAFSNSGARSG
jgi:hypothetical protein